jgi:1,2-phenylacetyl-CoA epoxidase catalytic subunit
MTDEMSVGAYLEQGGVLTSPHNASPRYRAELMKIMASFVDSELAGAAGFADVINAAPGLRERIAAARIVLEKTHHAEMVLGLMGEFGANTSRYAVSHPWADRLPRDTKPGTDRNTHDMRLSVFNYPLNGWVDAVTMNLVMGLAVGVQLGELTQVSYQPLADVLAKIAPVEANHVKLAKEGLASLITSGEAEAVGASIAYWQPRVALAFGSEDPKRFKALQVLGLRQTDSSTLRESWAVALQDALAHLGLAQ